MNKLVLVYWHMLMQEKQPYQKVYFISAVKQGSWEESIIKMHIWIPTSWKGLGVSLSFPNRLF